MMNKKIVGHYNHPSVQEWENRRKQRLNAAKKRRIARDEKKEASQTGKKETQHKDPVA